MIPVLGRSPGKWKVYPLQYSGLENSMDYTVAKSDMTERLSLPLFTFITYKRMKSAPHSILICHSHSKIPLDLLDCTDQVAEHIAWQPGNTAKLFLILDPTQT